jgi:NAD(P)-dependent dehydrogenase (short-subunit alcohol dehydrogenase family)
MAKGTVVITGANGGIGRCIMSRVAASPELASYHRIYRVRPASLSAFQARHQGQSGATSTVSLELSSLTCVREAAAAIYARVAAGEIPPIRALILNAGYTEMDAQRFSEDGFSIPFAVNHLGSWLLTLLLMQSMDRDAVWCLEEERTSQSSLTCAIR